MIRKKLRLALDRQTVRSLRPDEVRAVAGGTDTDTCPIPFTREFTVCRDCWISFEPAGC